MFENNHLFELLFAFIPAIIYSFVIFLNDRNNISIRTALSYILGGYLSISFLRVAFQVFPHLQDMFFVVENNLGLYIRKTPTFLSWFFHAFIQIGLMEEISKYLAWVSIGLFRWERLKNKDSLFATMFYCCMISVGFAGVENIFYFTTYEDIVLARSLTAVVLHMLCGIFLGYFIAISKLKRDKIQKLGLHAAGIAMAALFHGAYDFLIMGTNAKTIGVVIGPTTFEMLLVYPLLIAGFIMATVCGRSLLEYSQRYGVVQKKRNPSPLIE